MHGNIKKYEDPIDVQFNTPIRIKPTEQYEIRKSKFYKWLEIQNTQLKR